MRSAPVLLSARRGNCGPRHRCYHASRRSVIQAGPDSCMLRGRSGMVIADRLWALREQKKFSQGDIEKRTGLLRCYLSRLENGHTVPAIETLEKMARALEVPLY